MGKCGKWDYFHWCSYHMQQYKMKKLSILLLKNVSFTYINCSKFFHIITAFEYESEINISNDGWLTKGPFK